MEGANMLSIQDTGALSPADLLESTVGATEEQLTANTSITVTISTENGDNVTKDSEQIRMSKNENISYVSEEKIIPPNGNLLYDTEGQNVTINNSAINQSEWNSYECKRCGNRQYHE